MQERTDPILKQNELGYFELRWAERQPDGTWRSKRLSTRTTDRVQAEAFRREYLTAAHDADAKTAVLTLDELADQYLKARRSRMTPTQEEVLNRVRRSLGGLLPVQITPARIAAYRSSRRIADASARRELGAVVAVLNWARKARLLPLDAVPHIELPPNGQPRDEWLDEDQESEFYALAMGNSIGKPRLTRVTRFVALALDTAARKEAIHELTWDRVDLKAGLIDYRVPGARLSNKRRVPVPVSSRLAPLLERAHAERKGAFVIDEGEIRTAFETWRATLGQKYAWVTAHLMRHSWATLAARAGVPIWQIAGVLGDDPRTVERNYLHHCPDHLRAAVERRAG